MEWFHCNSCFQRHGRHFAVSSCGHIFCENCTNPNHCCVCRDNCSYLPVSDQMKPQEQVFFKDPLKLIQLRMDHIVQIARFQQKQKERVMAFLRHKSAKLERKLQDITSQYYRQVSELKRENAELKKPLSQRRASGQTKVSQGKFQTNRHTHRISLPVAVTSPVTPLSRSGFLSPADTMERFRDRHGTGSLATPPGSVASVSSLISLRERQLRTPSTVGTPTRYHLHLGDR